MPRPRCRRLPAPAGLVLYFDAWKRVFDGFHAFRAEHDVRSVRVGRRVDAESEVTIDLVFDDADAAATFQRALK